MAIRKRGMKRGEEMVDDKGRGRGGEVREKD